MSYPPSLAENDVAPSAAESDAAPSPAENYAVPRRTETSPESRTVETPPTTRTTGTPAGTTTAETGSSPGRLNGSLRTAQRSHRAGHWRRAWLQALAVLAAVVVGCGFGYVVARNDRPMQHLLFRRGRDGAVFSLFRVRHPTEPQAAQKAWLSVF